MLVWDIVVVNKALAALEGEICRVLTTSVMVARLGDKDLLPR